MGDPKKSRKKYETPKKLWDKSRIIRETDLVHKYGLRNKKEVWKISSKLKAMRQNARKLLALPIETRVERQKEIMGRIYRMGLLEKNANLDDILTLSVESLMERRLQTIVWRKNLANTPKQSRQIVVHGHIEVDSQKNSAPGHLVSRSEGATIKFHGKPMQLAPKTKKKEEKLKKKFEEAAGIKTGEEKTKEPAKEQKVEEKKAEKIEKPAKTNEKKSGGKGEKKEEPKKKEKEVEKAEEVKTSE